MLVIRNKRTSGINANHVTILVMLFLICIMLLPILLNYFIDWKVSNLSLIHISEPTRP